MPEAFPSNRPTLLPLLCYRDPERAIEWLRKSFGLETRCVAKRVDGGFAYAHLGSGEELIMVSPAPDAKTESLIKAAPDAGKSPPPQACYFVVADIEAHFKRAKDAGAAIELEIKDYEHGGRRYSCRDLEGHVWTFGTYDPWKGKTPSTDAAAKEAADKKPLANNRAPVAVARPRLSTLQSRLARRAGVIAAGALTLAAVGVTGWQLQSESRASLDAAATEVATQEAALRKTESEFAVAQQALANTRDELAQERTAREAAEAAQRAFQAELATERSGREQAERSAQELKAAAPGPQDAATDTAAQELAQARDALAEERKVRASAEASQREAAAALEQERTARQEVEKSAEAMKTELAAAQSARTAAEKTASVLDEQMKRDKQAAQAASAAKVPEPAPATPPAAVAAASSSTADGFVTTTTRAEPPVALASVAKPAAAVAAAQMRARSQNPKLAAGEAALAKGDLEAARRYFKELADAGVPEGALALGSTYDPKSFERAGLAGAQADRARAKEWYRRAIELAQTERQTPK